MDLAQTLIRSVMRTFYENRQILVVDALIIHSALRDDDLAYLVKMTAKDLQKMCAKLRADRFIASYSRPELKDGMQRPINRTYYYIDYRQAIDAIKWRVYTIGKDIQGNATPVSERKEFFCGFCKAEWTMMEVLDNPGREGFLCHRCGRTLTHDLERNGTGHEQSTRLNSQLKFAIDMLPRIDNVHVPDNNFDIAFAGRRPVLRDASHSANRSVPADPSLLNGGDRPAAVRGSTNLGPVSLSVNISASDGPSEAEKAAEQARREKIALQNALPEWMTVSTIRGEPSEAKVNGFGRNGGSSLEVKREETHSASRGSAGSHSFDRKDHSDIDDYFARLKQQAEQEALSKGRQEEEEDDEDDDFEFEDVISTSAALANGVGVGGTPTPTVSISFEKREGQPQIKKVRVAEDVKVNGVGVNGVRVNGVRVNGVKANGVNGIKVDEIKVEESDEDIEFEDV